MNDFEEVEERLIGIFEDDELTRCAALGRKAFYTIICSAIEDLNSTDNNRMKVKLKDYAPPSLDNGVQKILEPYVLELVINSDHKAGLMLFSANNSDDEEDLEPLCSILLANIDTDREGNIEMKMYYDYAAYSLMVILYSYLSSKLP